MLLIAPVAFFHTFVLLTCSCSPSDTPAAAAVVADADVKERLVKTGHSKGCPLVNLRKFSLIHRISFFFSFLSFDQIQMEIIMKQLNYKKLVLFQRIQVRDRLKMMEADSKSKNVRFYKQN